MPNCKVMLNNIDVSDNQLRVDVAVITGYDEVTPKMRAIFRRGEDIRRLPILIKGSFRRKELNDSVHIFSYNYFPSFVFTDKDNTDDIYLSFEVAFGDECTEDIEFFVSPGIATAKGLDHKYLAPEDFNGAMVFSSSTQADDDEELIFADYDYTPEPENKRVVISTLSKQEENTSKGFVFFSKIVQSIMWLWAICICIGLLPYFIIDGIFAGLGVVKSHRYKPTDSKMSTIIGQIKANITSFLKSTFKSAATAQKIVHPGSAYLKNYYEKLCKKPLKKNRITFISGRRDEISGNEKFVYDLIKDNKDIDFQFLMFSNIDEFQKFKNTKKFYELYATSKVVIVDDYFPSLNKIVKRDDVTLFQLWHACGAFKTFGFSRLGKVGGPKQTAPDHRMYDKAIVSSAHIVKYYSEGFGIPDKNVLPTGIPRTDVFFDKEYAERIKNDFYSRYPQLKDKKIILFAPTFRGNGQRGAFYPTEVFNPYEFLKNIGDDYAIILKLHPFCHERYAIDQEYCDRIFDFTDQDELNDLLFVTDLLITDYSSSVFEASLLDIPMLFYPYDLYQYISERDFYCDFETFVPGKIAFTQDAMLEAIKNNDFEIEKIEAFRNKFFSHTDGKSSERVADAIMDALRN